MDLKGKAAVVTGGSSGIGKAIVVALAKAGSNVVFTYNTGVKGAQETLEAIKQSSGQHLSVKADILVEDDIKNVFRIVKEKYGS